MLEVRAGRVLAPSCAGHSQHRLRRRVRRPPTPVPRLSSHEPVAPARSHSTRLRNPNYRVAPQTGSTELRIREQKTLQESVTHDFWIFTETGCDWIGHVLKLSIILICFFVQLSLIESENCFPTIGVCEAPESDFYWNRLCLNTVYFLINLSYLFVKFSGSAWRRIYTAVQVRDALFWIFMETGCAWREDVLKVLSFQKISDRKNFRSLEVYGTFTGFSTDLILPPVMFVKRVPVLDIFTSIAIQKPFRASYF